MKITRLPDYELYLTYSWGRDNHGICGHTYEVIDYYMHLKNHIKCAILLCEDITPEIFSSAIREKYIYSDDVIDKILENTIFINRPSVLSGKNILFTDGEITDINIHVKLLFKNVFLFGCGDKSIINMYKHNYHVLLDHRVYETNKGTDYIKKIDFKNLKKPVNPDNRTLVYATENCRAVDQDMINSLDGDLLIISNTPYSGNNIIVESPPVKNLYSRFNKYVYTPVKRKWDCSPRFIAECKYFNIDVIYHEIDYLDVDLGLKYRLHDIENNFDSLEISNDMFIIDFIKGIM